MTEKSKPPGYDTDALAWKLAKHLLEDFRPFLDKSFYDAVSSAVDDCNIKVLRGIKFDPNNSNLSVFELKVRYQLLDLFKKYSFRQDVYTPEEVLEMSKKKFLDNQARLDSFVIEETPLVKEIIFRAKGHIDTILGDFSKFDILERATFGKKSSV